MMNSFLHELSDAKALFEVVANEKQINPIIVEKDYWLTHCLWSLQQQGLVFELKGGTSLSKGFNLINRFSEDIDIKIYPNSSLNLKTGKNHDKSSHIQNRKQFFDVLAKNLKAPDMTFHRDYNFDDEKMRNAGIRAEYQSLFSSINALKSGVVLELGFDQTTPNIPCNINSWVLDKALVFNIAVIHNQAKAVKCYCPEYTFVEKLQTISTKYRLQRTEDSWPINFLRHYYDVYQLLGDKRVLDFIGTEKYVQHKEKRFRSQDEKNIKNNEAFLLTDGEIRKLYTEEYQKKSAIYFGDQPNFESILKRIEKHIDQL